MSSEVLTLSPKYKAFMKTKPKMEMLEGTTAAGKTTVGIFKFMLMVAQSPKKYHIIASQDTGTAEKNIINKDLGIIDDFGALAEYKGNGTKDEKIPHIVFHAPAGDKVVYVMGYANKEKWKKALGGQYGCLYIDEINTADIEFVRESTMRADYVMGTLNPDNPDLPIYKEYVNRCRPLKQYEMDAPKEIRELMTEPEKEGWLHWFFCFDDNYGLPEDKKRQIIDTVPEGTKLYKNKILGIRGKATGLVFPNFDRKKHTVSEEWVREQVRKKNKGGFYFKKFTAGLDTAYSQSSEDTVAMTFAGITNTGIYIVLAEDVYNNKGRTNPFAPSDIAQWFNDFLMKNANKWGIARNTFIDCADAATITEIKKWASVHGSMFVYNGSYKKITIANRINLQLGWIQTGHYLVLDTCENHIFELENYAWQDGKDEPEDKNDHTINSCQYNWIPYKDIIGKNEKGTN